MNIPQSVQKRAIFEQEFRSVIETRNIFSPVATILVSQAKNIVSPYITVGNAKQHTTPCVVPVTEASVGVDELVLDRYIGNAITDCREELSYAKFDVIGRVRRALYATVIKKGNQVAATDFIADATSPGGTVALGSADQVATFLITVKAEADFASVGLAQSVDGATIKEAPFHDKPFVVAGTSAYVAIKSKIASIVAQSSTVEIAKGIEYFETPYGVLVINAGSAFADPKQMIYGVGGALTMAYREDQVEVDMGEVTSLTTFNGASADLDLDPGDNVIKKTWYISAQTKGKNGIYSDVSPLVKEQKMA